MSQTLAILGFIVAMSACGEPHKGVREALETVSPEDTKALCAMPTLEQQVGAMLLVGFAGTQPGDAGVEAVRQQAEAGRIAGVIFMGYNVVSGEQVTALTKYMHAWSTPRPLIIAIDQEGGAVTRLPASKGFATYPAALDVAQSGDATVYSALATDIAQLGFTLNFAPVVDVAIRADGPAIGARRRAFGSDDATVQEWARRFIRAHRHAGVRTTIKHFPGHGSASGDSHHGLTDVTDDWTQDEMRPFHALIASGDADAVMSAHVTHHRLDARWPLSLSPSFLPTHLRGAAGYDGALISDALDMGALWRFYSLEDITVAAIAASHDLLVFSMNAAAHGGAAGYEEIDQLPDRAVNAVREALCDGRLAPTTLQAAHRRATAFARGDAGAAR